MATRQTHDKAFKQEAVRLVKTSGKSQRQIADDPGIGLSTLSRWCTETAEQGEHAFVGSGNLQPEAEEMRRLRRENDILRQERDILKKSPIEYLIAELSPISFLSSLNCSSCSLNR
jgi:transposase